MYCTYLWHIEIFSLLKDLNRIVKKPYVEEVEGAGKPDTEVANESWRLYKSRNDSIIVDLFQGQLKSKLTCPVCKKVRDIIV